VTLYVDGVPIDTGTTSGDSLQSTTDFVAGGGTSGSALRDTRYDDPRIYRTALSCEEIEDLVSIGDEHNSTDLVGDAWENRGIPFRGPNKRLGGTLAEEKDYIFRQLDYVHESYHIDKAAGEQLDSIGAVVGVNRKEGESDDKLRARIKAVATAARSQGTFADILNATASIVNTDKERVEIQFNYLSEPGTAFVYVRTSDLSPLELTPTELREILQDVVVAGHRVEVIEQGANPFTVRNDSQANDPSLGLTSDTISTGGGLVSDL
jgi:hypothetical protein